MKYIAFFVLVHCMLTFVSGMAFHFPPWMVWKILALGFRLGVYAMWALSLWHFLNLFRRN